MDENPQGTPWPGFPVSRLEVFRGSLNFKTGVFDLQSYPLMSTVGWLKSYVMTHSHNLTLDGHLLKIFFTEFILK